WKNRLGAALHLQTVEVTGLENIPVKGPALLAPNHLNWKDIFFTAAVVARQLYFVGTHELFDYRFCRHMIYKYSLRTVRPRLTKPFFKWLATYLARVIVPRVRRVGTIPIKRNDHDRQFFEVSKEYLRMGRAICIFPEGRIGDGKSLRPFKMGAAKILLDLYHEGRRHIPAIPIAIKGTERFFLPWRKLVFRVGRPIYIDDFIDRRDRVSMLSFTRELQNRVAELFHRA
ncbi:MAG: 1-acyl-sn-glycerol-3-phosphate acyltransferase, partial [candidate division KSB1 bacterium]|nr:1-acyl-sn-glycerol-3-phosphate acyltransferase [candidate division KSB1 bacterium]